MLFSNELNYWMIKMRKNIYCFGWGAISADKILLRKRAIIESVNDELKNICQIQHTRHRSFFNWVVNLLSGLVAFSFFQKNLL